MKRTLLQNVPPACNVPHDCSIAVELRLADVLSLAHKDKQLALDLTGYGGVTIAQSTGGYMVFQLAEEAV